MKYVRPPLYGATFVQARSVSSGIPTTIGTRGTSGGNIRWLTAGVENTAGVWPEYEIPRQRVSSSAEVRLCCCQVNARPSVPGRERRNLHSNARYVESLSNQSTEYRMKSHTRYVPWSSGLSWTSITPGLIAMPLSLIVLDAT